MDLEVRIQLPPKDCGENVDILGSKLDWGSGGSGGMGEWREVLHMEKGFLF